jgi:pimeloyl-ACP methyl ester carboxylesterase
VALPDGSVTLACPGSEESSVYEGAVHHDAFDRLGDLALPVTLAGAATGGDIDAGLLERLAGRIPGAVATPLGGVTHFGPMEDPDRIAALIVDALAGGR